MSTASPSEVFRKLVDGIVERRYDELPALYAEQTDVRHPMAPYPVKPLLSRDDLRKHFGGAASQIATIQFRAENVIIHQTTAPEVIVAEFAYVGTSQRTGKSFEVPGIFVMRVRDGLIVESRDYIDHVTMSKARGQLDQLVAALTS